MKAETLVDKTLPRGTDIVYKLRVERTKMRNFPFDVTYFVHRDRKDLCARIFPWSLCMPIKEGFAVRLERIAVCWFENIPLGQFRRSWDVQNCKLRDGFAWEDYFALIPILPLMKKKHEPKKRYAAYIGAPQHAGNTELKFADILDDDTVLFTPQGPINPVCVRCPLHMLHIQGKCALGSKQCYNELILKGQVDSEQLQDDDAQSDQSA